MTEAKVVFGVWDLIKYAEFMPDGRSPRVGWTVMVNDQVYGAIWDTKESAERDVEGAYNSYLGEALRLFKHQPEKTEEMLKLLVGRRMQQILTDGQYIYLYIDRFEIEFKTLDYIERETRYFAPDVTFLGLEDGLIKMSNGETHPFARTITCTGVWS